MFINNPTRVLKGHEGAVHIVRYNSNGQYCISGGQDRSICLWNPNTGAKIKSYEAHGWEVLDITIAFDNAKFASVGGDKAAYFHFEMS